MANDNDDEFSDYKEQVLQTVRETYAKFHELEQRITGEIAEYKRTVNNAIGLLSKEFLDFRDSDDKRRAKRQRYTDRINYGMLGLGCFVICIGCFVILLLSYAIYLLRFAPIVH